MNRRDPLSIFLYILAIVVVVWLLLEIVARI